MPVIYFLLYILFILAWIMFKVAQRRYSFWKDRKVPHDEPVFFYGNLRESAKKRKHFSQVYTEAYQKYKGTGPFAGFYNFFTPAALILDLELVKSILIKDFANFSDRSVFYNEIDDPLTAHLFSLDGSKWKSLRQKLTPTFTSGKMKFMLPTVVQVSHQFVDVLRDTIETAESAIEIKELMARFTTDVIGTCAFGIDCNSLKDPNAEFRVMGRRIFTDRRHMKYVSFFIHAFPALARKLRMRQFTDATHNFFMRVVRENVEYREKNNIQRNDFMNMLIELKNTNTLNGEQTSLSMEEVAAQAFLFFIAGFETSSTTMGFCLHELAQHLDIQERVRLEINECLERHKGCLTYECMNEMVYLEQIICETLRKYSIVTQFIRKTKENYHVPNSKYVIEKDTLVVIPVHAIHYDPDIYPEPEVFNPDRFTAEEIQKRHSSAWLPFGDGPRNCIGLRFGKMQTRIGLIALLKNFTFTVCPKTDVPVKIDPKSFLLSSEGGIYLNVKAI